MRFLLALSVFFKVLFDQQVAQAIESVLNKKAETASASAGGDATRPAEIHQPTVATPPQRNDAITLLATLQREARFVDIVKEPLGDYSDAQIGAAARDVLRDCGEAIDRLFDLKPILEEKEGAEVETPAGYDPGRYRLTGSVSGEPPYSGQLIHHGWKASHCRLPQWSGGEDSALVVAPIELEVKS